MTVPGGGGTGVKLPAGRGVIGTAALEVGTGFTGCAVGAPGDGNAGSVVTETIGVGAGVFAAFDEDPVHATSAPPIASVTNASNPSFFNALSPTYMSTSVLRAFARVFEAGGLEPSCNYETRPLRAIGVVGFDQLVRLRVAGLVEKLLGRRGRDKRILRPSDEQDGPWRKLGDARGVRIH